MEYVLMLEYDGTDFAGSQYQPGCRTVQGSLEQSVSGVATLIKRAQFASRTDSGVHAVGQIVKIAIDKDLPTDKLQSALNYYLDKDISVKFASIAQPNFNPRSDAVSRLYTYTINHGQARSPQNDRFSWQLQSSLAIDMMDQAVSLLPKDAVDWSPFAGKMPDHYSSIRVLQDIHIESDNDRVKIFVRASGFLPHQVRRMVGAIQKVGSYKMSIEKFSQLIHGPSHSVQYTAPAKGLNLSEIQYNMPLFQ
ncbi:MAG: tRNA pseudouridine(38-40) synthase TruA [Dehalococcoidia bacterium]|nr:tRNA pseudouridine(38-40) synthase TruA [Dehalococcoidia bacterium]